MAKKKPPAQERAFLADICAHPDDDTPRLVYADWLDDPGQPHRAEFIRLQMGLPALPEDDPDHEAIEEREWELLTAYRAEWDEALPPWARRVPHEYRRGFPEEFTLSVMQFL